MKSRIRRLREQVEERWPTLCQFLGCYCHEDWPEFHGTPEGAVSAAIADYPLDRRKQVLLELRDWSEELAGSDLREALNDGLGVNVHFKTAEAARQFADVVHDKLRLSIRNEHPHWTPSGKRISQ